MSTRRIPAHVGLLTLALAALPTGSVAQGVRGWATTTARYVQLRPIGQDSVARSSVTQAPDGRLLFDGRPVYCVTEARCVLYRALDREYAASATQDVAFTAWGLGVQGLSATFLLRGRAELGGELTWPRTDDAFDAILAYAELTRGPVRVRAGRQRTTSGLGFTSFDGGSAVLQPDRRVRVEAYGGRSLARGLAEPRHEALQGADELFPDRNAYLFGGLVELTPRAGTSLAVRYQREIWTDRSALISERASVDLRTALVGRLRLLGSVDYDFAFGRVGKAHADFQIPVTRSAMVEILARRYVPYFELWTIWGFFSPVPYHEVEMRTTWSPASGLGVWGSGGWRSYDETNAPVIMEPMKDEGWRLGLGGRFQRGAWAFDGRYRLERGPGAYLSSGDLRARFQANERVRVAVHGSAFQQIEEFRVGEGAAVGGGADVEIELTPRTSWSAGLSGYRNMFDNRNVDTDWTQFRAWSALTVEIGGDPGLARRRVR